MSWARGQAIVLEHLAGHQRDVDDAPPGNPGHRIQVDPQFVGVVEVVGKHRVRVEVDAAQVDRPRQSRGIVDHRLGSRSASRITQFGNVDPVGPLGRGALLKHRFFGDAVDEALQDHRPAGHATQRAVGHGQVIAH